MNWIKKLLNRGQSQAQPDARAANAATPPPAVDAAKAPTKDEFAELLLERLISAGAPGFSYDAAAFRIHAGTRFAFLDNSYDAYCHAQGSRREFIVANFIGMLTSTHEEADRQFDTVRDQLITVVRERAYFSLSALDLQIHDCGQPPDAVTEPLTRWFVKAMVIDAPSHMSLVNESMPFRWQHTTDELFAVGWEKLRSFTEPQFTEDQRVFRGTWNDDYDSSRILVPGVFDSLGLDGDPVVTIPNRLTLLVTGSNEADAIRRMLTMAEQIVEKEPRPQNPAPLVVRPDGITDFHVDPTSPIFDAVQRAHRFAALMYYQEQKGKLERLYARQGKTIHVAKYTLIEQDSGLYCSHAVWPKDDPTLLPMADEIAFVDATMPEGRQCVARVPWERVVETVPELLLDAKMFPERYYVSHFPTDAQFARMHR